MPFARKSKNVFVFNKSITNKSKQPEQSGFPDLPTFFTDEPIGKDQKYPIERGGVPDFTCQRFIPFFSDQCSDIVGNSDALCEGNYLKCESNPYKKNGEESIISYHCGTTSDGQQGNQRIPIPAICKPISGTNPDLEGGNTTVTENNSTTEPPLEPPLEQPLEPPLEPPLEQPLEPLPEPPLEPLPEPPPPPPEPPPSAPLELPIEVAETDALPEVAETDEETDEESNSESDIEPESNSESSQLVSNLNIAIPLDNGQKLRLIIE